MGASGIEGVNMVGTRSSEEAPFLESWPRFAFGVTLLALGPYFAGSSLDVGGVLEGMCFRALAAWIGITSSGRGGLEGYGAWVKTGRAAADM